MIRCPDCLSYYPIAFPRCVYCHKIKPVDIMWDLRDKRPQFHPASPEPGEEILQEESAETYTGDATDEDIAELAAMKEDPWGDAGIECWCESNFIANDLGLTKE